MKNFVVVWLYLEHEFVLYLPEKGSAGRYLGLMYINMPFVPWHVCLPWSGGLGRVLGPTEYGSKVEMQKTKDETRNVAAAAATKHVKCANSRI